MPKDPYEQLGERFRMFRKNAHLTQQQLSDLSHVSVKHIADIEKGKKNPSIGIVASLKKVLHFSVDQLLDPNATDDDTACEQMKQIDLSCPPEARANLLNATRAIAKELSDFSSQFRQE